MKIPERWSDLTAYWEKLTDFVAVEKSVHDRTVTFLVEPPRAGYLHHCTIQDVVRVLDLLPADHVAYLDLVVFRQPTAKQSVLAPVWGRLGYWSEIGRHEGPGVYLEAQPQSLKLHWGKSLRPDDRAELNRLKEVGFRIETHARGYHIHATPETIRATQLYRTIPHEIGHYVDYVESKRTYEWGDDYERFWELYDAKPSREKEVYAHRYADQFRREMEAKHLVPFPSTYEAESIRRDHLVPEWFARLEHAI